MIILSSKSSEFKVKKFKELLNEFKPEVLVPLLNL